MSDIEIIHNIPITFPSNENEYYKNFKELKQGWIKAGSASHLITGTKSSD